MKLSPSFALVALLASGGAIPAQDAPELARKAKAVLEKHCHVCHGKNGSVSGGFGHVLDRNRLVEAKTLVPGDPDGSRMFRR